MTPSGSTFDPAAVSVTLRPIGTIQGGPIAFAAVADGSGRTFVAARDGRIWILRGATVDPTPLLDLRQLVSSGGERGLLGIAIGNTFPTDPRVFVDYTDADGNTAIASYRLDPTNADRLDPSTVVRILSVQQPFANHNGGALAFGPDGLLYVSLGDGGGAGDPLDNGQRSDTLLGKILRLDVGDGSHVDAPYTIPSNNPLVGQPGARGEIWLTGLRNPWRMAFDRATGDLWIGDVGQSAWEEIDVAPAGVGGRNFGWNIMEGSHCFAPATGCQASGLTMPVAEYGHELGCTVIGGTVYRGPDQPLITGAYLFADYCSGRIWALAAGRPSSAKPVQVGTTMPGIVSFGEDARGEILAANLDGTISTVVAAAR